jgi:flagellin
VSAEDAIQVDGEATLGAQRSTFQVGANAEQVVRVGITGVGAEALGVVGLQIGEGATEESIAAAIEAIDTAIGTVSENRATLGAFQNRMESTIRNVSVAVENLSAAESRIRDTDMAAEMVTFTRNQILQQAGTAMLAQANQVPQSVLSLLR